MADEAPPKLIQIGPQGGLKKDGFNLVTERVVSVNPEAKQLEVELLAYDGKTVMLDVAEEALEDLHRSRSETARRSVSWKKAGADRESFKIAQGSERRQSRRHVVGPQRFALAESEVRGRNPRRTQRSAGRRTIGRGAD
jgi:hypothetical protein